MFAKPMIALEFSNKYDDAHARQYFFKHQAGLARQRAARGGQGENTNRFVVARSQIESEFASAGFTIVDHHDFLPGYAMWRVYTLRKSA